MPTHYNILEDKELFEYLGRALYECQRLEIDLAYTIRDARLLKKKNQARDLLEYLKKLQKILHSRLDQTLGTLVGEFRDLGLLDNSSERLLRKALDKRNEIVHHFFYKHWVAMITPVGRDVMLNDLKKSIEIIREAKGFINNKIRKQLDALMKPDADNLDDVH